MSQDTTSAAGNSIDCGKSPPTNSVHFWGLVAALTFTALCSSLEGTIITSALPTISKDLSMGSTFIWIPNTYLLATTIVLPLMAQASDVFGRRGLTLLSVATFTLGSGLCGGANGGAMLIAGRAVYVFRPARVYFGGWLTSLETISQGLGGGGIALMINIVLADLVPLQERGKYMAIVQMVSAVGAALGPFLGGLLTTHSTWRWVFYVNVPIGGTSFAILFFLLHTATPSSPTWKERYSRIDIAGSVIFAASTISMLFGITWDGTEYPWTSYHVITPLVLGFVGYGIFLTYEWTFAANPSVPRSVVMDRTAAAVLGVTFCHTICIYFSFYFMPIYFQAVKGWSPFRSGIDTLPLFAGMFPFSIIGGITLSNFGRYKPLHLLGMAIVTVCLGLFSILGPHSTKAAWVCFQLLFACGSGLMIAVLLPAMQAPLDEHHVALSTGVWAFVRSFSTVWGTTIPAAAFNSGCRKQAITLTDESLVEYLNGGKAYQYATQAFLDSIQDPTSRAQVIHIFSSSIRTVWYVAIAFAGFGWALVWAEKEVSLRTELNTKYGLKDRKANAKEEAKIEESSGNETV